MSRIWPVFWSLRPLKCKEFSLDSRYRSWNGIQITSLIGAIRKAHPDLPIHVHSHDTAGIATASMIAAAAAGADVVDVAIDSQFLTFSMGRQILNLRISIHQACRDWLLSPLWVLYVWLWSRRHLARGSVTQISRPLTTTGVRSAYSTVVLRPMSVLPTPQCLTTRCLEGSTQIWWYLQIKARVSFLLILIYSSKLRNLGSANNGQVHGRPKNVQLPDGLS